jgi:hypothetical protein
MSTPADVLKTVILAGTYDTYRKNTAPAVKIQGKDKLTTAPVDRMITLKIMNENPIFTFNGVRIKAGQSYVDLIMIDQDPDERDNLHNDLEDVFQKSSYDITFTVTAYFDMLSPYSKRLKIKILL